MTTITLPRRALFVLYALRLIKAPILVVPTLLLTVAAMAAVDPPFWAIPIVYIAAVFLVFPVVCITSARSMQAAGVLEDYLAAIATSTWAGRRLCAWYDRGSEDESS